MRNHRKFGTPRFLALGLMLVVAGCRGTPTANPPPVTTLGTSAATATALPAVTTTTTTTAIPDTTGADFAKVMQNLDLLLSMASERVDLSLLDLIYTPDAEQRVIVEKQLRYLRDNGLRYSSEGERSKVYDVTAKTPLDGVAVVDLTSSLSTQVLVDASGQVIQTGEGWAPRRERYGLFRGQDGRWRIRDYSALGPA